MITFCIYFCVKLGLLQLYPTYVSFKAIKVNDEKELQTLLIYWVVAITYLSLEYFADIFLFWLPFYTELKLIIVLWLILPQTQGAFVTYSHHIDPFLQQHQTYIDKAILDIQMGLKEVFVLYGKHLIEFIKASLSEMLFRDTTTEKGKTVDQEPPPPTTTTTTTTSAIEREGYPYQLFSSWIANRQPQDKESAEVLYRSDSQESLQSYVDINSGLPTTAAPLTWGAYLSSWVVRAPVTASVEKEE